ncbi:MAG: hypothetical protein Q4F97_03505 [Bacteroidales bacterium]|nr:hypothetical protein [Bacteroidales bacterium]
MKEFKNIKNEKNDKDKLPADKHYPDQQISEENYVIIGDVVETDEPPLGGVKKNKPNYVLITTIIVVLIVALFWGIKGCNERSYQQNSPEATEDIIP